jgi:hypothetical protein
MDSLLSLPSSQIIRYPQAHLILWLEITVRSSPEIRLVELFIVGFQMVMSNFKRHFRDVCTHPMNPDVTVLSSRRKGFPRRVNRDGVDGPAATIKYD